MRSEISRCMNWFIVSLIIPLALANGTQAPQNLAGLVVEEVSADSPAAKAGLKVGDRILTYDEKALASPPALQAAVRNTFGKKEVVLQVLRGAERLTLRVPLGLLGIGVRPELPSEVLKLYEEGMAALRAKKVKEAIDRLEAAAKAAKGPGERAAAAWLYGRAGESYGGQRQWKEAIEAQMAAWEILKQGSDAAAQSRVLVELGQASQNLNDFAAAERWFEQARKVDAAGGHEMWAAGDLISLGKIASNRSNLQAAWDYFSQALAISERLAPDSREAAACLNNLGIITNARGNLQAAQGYYSRALAINKRLAPDSRDVAFILNNLGIVAGDRGELQTAQEYHHQALEIRMRLAPNSLEVADSFTGLGNVACALGDLHTAQEYHRQALAIREQLSPDSPNVAASFNNLGNVALARGDLQAAENYYNQALTIKKRLAPNSLTVAFSLGNLGLVAKARGDLQAAQEYHRQALAIHKQHAPNSLGVAKSFYNLGNVVHDRGDFHVAQDYHSQALAIRERLAPNSLGVAESLTQLGNLAFRDQRFSHARSLFDRAVAIIEAQRSSIPSTGERSLFFGKYHKSYLGLLQTHLAFNDFPAAFAILERARARSLVDLLAERPLDFKADAPADLLKQQNLLDQNRSTAYATLAKLNSEKDGKRIAELQNELTRYGIQQRELEAQFRRASPRFANLQYPEPLDLTGAQAALDEGTLLLAYYVDEKQTYLFAVTKTALKVFTLPLEEAVLTKRVNAFRDTVSHKRLGNPLQEVQKQGQKLYDDLIRPAQEWVSQAKRILICLDGALHSLPFAALTNQTKPTPHYFIEDKPLHMIVSMTVYTETRKSAEASGTKLEPTVLALGDAIYAKEQTEPATKQELLAQAQRSASKGKEKVKNDPMVKYDLQRGLKLAPLPGTRKEVEAIARLYGSATVKLGQDVTKTAAQRESPNYTILHFAVHGWLDNQMGLNSGLALSQPEALGRKIEKSDNGLWQAWEIIEQTRVKADLVVLSACMTGLGQEVRGEGVIGLTRAFQYAGAKSVVVSLWSVSDASTAALMSAFHQELRKGIGKDVALQKAMMAVRSNPKWAHPYYWSAFILSGDWK